MPLLVGIHSDFASMTYQIKRLTSTIATSILGLSFLSLMMSVYRWDLDTIFLGGRLSILVSTDRLQELLGGSRGLWILIPVLVRRCFIV